MLHTELQTGVPKERSQRLGLDAGPAADSKVEETEELVLAVDGQLAGAGRVGVHLPDEVPIPDEDVVQRDLLVGVVVHMGVSNKSKVQ